MHFTKLLQPCKKLVALPEFRPGLSPVWDSSTASPASGPDLRAWALTRSSSTD